MESLPLEFDKINKEKLVLQQKQVFPKLFESVSAETEYALSDDILVSVKRRRTCNLSSCGITTAMA